MSPARAQRRPGARAARRPEFASHPRTFLQPNLNMINTASTNNFRQALLLGLPSPLQRPAASRAAVHLCLINETPGIRGAPANAGSLQLSLGPHAARSREGALGGFLRPCLYSSRASNIHTPCTVRLLIPTASTFALQTHGSVSKLTAAMSRSLVGCGRCVACNGGLKRAVHRYAGLRGRAPGGA